MCTDETIPAVAAGAWFPDQRHERRTMAWAFSAALLVHVLFVFVHLPAVEPPPTPPEPAYQSPTLVDIPLPLPPRLQPAIELTDFPRRDPVPVPFPPDVQVPIGGGNIDRILIAAPETPVLIGDSSPPPGPPGPATPDGRNVSFPLLIPESKVSPDYPELARTVRLQGRVILQAVIRKDGTVEEVSVLQSTRPGVGFEQAAIEAIRRWRYEPAVQNGVPLDVYFTIVVEFSLQ
jgi:protein TonB